MKHLEYCERRSIERFLSKGLGIRAIARNLKRSPSTISTEIKQGKVRNIYRADRAQKKAERRREQSKQQCLKVALNPVLKAYVIEKMTDNQSPTAISGRIKEIDTHLPYVSPKAVYNFVHSVHGRPLEKHLYRKRVKKKSGPKRGSTRPSDRTKVSIEDRPAKANKRLEFGHFEGDFIESGKAGKGSLLVLVERKTRRTFIAYTEAKTTVHINRLIHQMIGHCPIKSLTLDNDIAFQKHEELSSLIGVVVYFARPYTSADKGAVENRNGVIREFVPKGCDISKVSKQVFVKAERHLNTRYMQCLKFRTALESWGDEVVKLNSVKIEKTTAVVSGD